MSGFILLLLIIGVLYIATTYLKGPRNTYTDSDSLTTRPFGGEDAGNDGLQPELEDAEEEPDIDETDADQDFEVNEFSEAQEADNANKTDKFYEKLLDSDETDVHPEANAIPPADAATAPGAAPGVHSFTNSGVVIDTEVHIDAQMPSETGTAGTPNNTGK